MLNRSTMSYLLAAAFGWIAGMRTLAAPAFLSHRLAQQTPRHPGDPAERLLSSQTASTAFTLAAVGEALLDKVPGIPDRIDAPFLIGRVLSGALAGAAVAAHQGERGEVGALVGAGAALVSAYATFHLRQQIVHRLNVPDQAVAVAEDGFVVGVGAQLLHALGLAERSPQRRMSPMATRLERVA